MYNVYLHMHNRQNKADKEYVCVCVHYSEFSTLGGEVFTHNTDLKHNKHRMQIFACTVYAGMNKIVCTSYTLRPYN